MTQRRVNEWNQSLSIMLNAELFQIKVAVRLVVGVGLRRKVVCTNRHPAVRKASAICGVKQFVHYAFAVLLAERQQRCPAQFVETCAEALHACSRLFSRLLHWGDVQIEHVPSERRLEDVPLLPRAHLGAGDECNSVVVNGLRSGNLGDGYPGAGKPGKSRARRNLRGPRHNLPSTPQLLHATLSMDYGCGGIGAARPLPQDESRRPTSQPPFTRTSPSHPAPFPGGCSPQNAPCQCAAS